MLLQCLRLFGNKKEKALMASGDSEDDKKLLQNLIASYNEKLTKYQNLRDAEMSKPKNERDEENLKTWNDEIRSLKELMNTSINAIDRINRNKHATKFQLQQYQPNPRQPGRIFEQEQCKDNVLGNCVLTIRNG